MTDQHAPTSPGHGDAPTDDHAHDEPHIHLPSPSVTPIVSAFGITMITFGFLAGWVYSIFGGVVLAISIWKWTAEMRRDAA